jgi:hypothetical protein
MIFDKLDRDFAFVVADGDDYIAARDRLVWNHCIMA